MSNTYPDVVENVRIEDPRVRKRLGLILYVLLFLVAALQLFLGFFPEVGDIIPGDFEDRAISFVSGLVLLVGGWWGVAVTTPNIPSPHVR